MAVQKDNAIHGAGLSISNETILFESFNENEFIPGLPASITSAHLAPSRVLALLFGNLR